MWKTGHRASECTTKGKVCFMYGEEGHFKKDCPNREGATKPNVPSTANARAFQVILNEAGEDERDHE